mgnify:CR=1 FL=1
MRCRSAGRIGRPTTMRKWRPFCENISSGRKIISTLNFTPPQCGQTVEEIRQAPLHEYGYDLPLGEVGPFDEIGFPLPVGDHPVSPTRTQPRGEGQNRQVAVERLVETPGVLGALMAVLIDRNPERTQRIEVHEQVVDHHPRIPEITGQLVGQHHAVHPAERVVGGEQVPPGGIERLEVTPQVRKHDWMNSRGGWWEKESRI